MNGFVIFLIFFFSSVAHHYNSPYTQSAEKDEPARAEQPLEQNSAKGVK